MKPRSLSAALLVLFALTGVTAARACKYCWAAEAAQSEYAQQTMSTPSTPPGAFPLDTTINQFQANAPTSLATPPPAGTVVTSAADLKAAVATARGQASPSPAATAPVVAQVPTVPAQGSGHFADAGLLSLAAVGGVFCWRTRRKPSSGR